MTSVERKKNLVPWLAGGAILSVAIVAGVLLLVDGHRVEGSFSVPRSDCQGSGDDEDIGPGTSVTIRNESGSTIATGSLEAGVGASGGCAYLFAVNGVPDAKLYRVEVSDGGEVEYSLARPGSDWRPLLR
jgi:hypothetical protein